MGTPGVDGRHTTSNHVIEAEQTLGIEAARKCIIDEIQCTMASHGMSIDLRHTMLLADVMTYKDEENDGYFLCSGILVCRVKYLELQAVHGRVDEIEGVSECIIMGIPMPIGTGLFKICQQVEKLPKLAYGPLPLLS
ncbi:unnamed protein product [Sphagnum troendelagicum]|uniref:DNA-directed RNA polymerase n=1 Tax=Sphagnum troendelagicum TaxID=128251 RepID=A0ABP0UZZ9_9BRYO